jgi:glucokinase
MAKLKNWNLLADIGGTNARFAIHNIDNDTLDKVVVLSVADHPTFVGALQYLLQLIQKDNEFNPYPLQACLAVACPVEQALIKFTNSLWEFTREQVTKMLNNSPLQVINDFSAVAWSIPQLEAFEWHQIGGASSEADKPVAILGPGTGLGMCTLVPTSNGYMVMAGEGGHIDFAPVTPRQRDLLVDLGRKFERVSVERLLSGSGIVNIYESLCAIDGTDIIFRSAQQITVAAIDEEEEKARETLSIFCQVLGATAGNLALITNARGGVYIAGGIVPRFLDFILNSEFRRCFEEKGRFKGYLETIPVRVILKEHLGLFGALQKLKNG